MIIHTNDTVSMCKTSRRIRTICCYVRSLAPVVSKFVSRSALGYLQYAQMTIPHRLGRLPLHRQESQPGKVSGFSFLQKDARFTFNALIMPALRQSGDDSQQSPADIESNEVPPQADADDAKALNRKERRRANKMERGRIRHRLVSQGGEEEEAISISRKSALSQNLLVDESVISRMCAAVKDDSPNGKCVVELGPGLGALTSPLLEDYPFLTAVELDDQACAQLRNKFPRLKLVEGSLLDFDFKKQSEQCGGRISVISNLPFGITSSALYHILDNSQHIRRAVLLVQQEVADRLLSDSTKRKYGSLTIEFSLRSSSLRQIFAVPSIAFDPPPKNTKCAVLVVDFQEELPLTELEFKILRNSLQAAFDDKGLPLGATLAKRKALRLLVPELRAYCEGSSNWLRKKPSELAPGKWIHVARSLAAHAEQVAAALAEEANA